MPDDVQLAVRGFIDLGQWLLDEWGSRGLKIAGQVDAGTATVDDVVNDGTDLATLALNSLVLIVSEFFDAAAVLTGEQDQPHIVSSANFDASGGVNVIGTDRVLRLAGALIDDFGDVALPETRVTIVPSELLPNQTQFHLEADVTGYPAVGYSGTVNVLDGPTGNILETVFVSLAG
jgi:hypothetical protein